MENQIAIQRVTNKIPKKGAKGSPLWKLRARLKGDFKLVLRDPTDCGRKRTKETASKEVIEKNIQKSKGKSSLIFRTMKFMRHY